jgi:hypothetical protein
MLITPPTNFCKTLIPFPVTTQTMSLDAVLALGDGLAEVDLLVVPLIGQGFDALDVIQKLGLTVFMGRVRFVSRPLADREMVLRELCAAAEPLGLTVDLCDGQSFESGVFTLPRRQR